MNNELIEELSKLKLEEKSLKRSIDVTYYDKEKRTKYFLELRKVKNQIENVKFRIRLNKELHDGKSR